MYRGDIPLRSEKLKDFDVLCHDGVTVANIREFRCMQSFGYQTDFAEVPTYYVTIRCRDRLEAHRTRSLKTFNRWHEHWQTLPRPATVTV